ncbi:MAG: SdpI family protein [Oscillospiraceae bacterium]|nr:SdpI family protein [Oscillospiraceae bacterium]
MIKKNKWKLLISSIVTLLPVIVGLIMWDSLPERMATHWGFTGAADGFSSRPFAVFALPLILLAGHWVCVIVTAADPKNKNQTQKAVSLVFWICPFVSLFSGAVIYAAAFGMNFSINILLPVVTGLIFIVIGNYLPKCKQNYTMGIKVAWTLENEENWNATHRFGGRVWVIGGVLLMLCAFLPNTVMYYVFIVLISLLGIIPVIYSYVYYRRH